MAGRTLRTVCAAVAASAVLLSGCGDTEEPAPVEPAQAKPEHLADRPSLSSPCAVPQDVKPNLCELPAAVEPDPCEPLPVTAGHLPY